MSTGTSKMTLYLAIACGVLVLILVALVAITFASGGDPTVPGAATVAATAAAAEAARREAARRKLEAAKAEGKAAERDLVTNRDEAKDDADAVREDVMKATDDELEREGEALFGPDAKTDPGVY